MQSDPNYFVAFEQAHVPLYSMATDYTAGHHFATHAHDTAQLLYAIEGLMLIETTKGRWIVPSQRGVWLAPQTWHAVTMLTAVKMRSVFIQPSVVMHFNAAICVLQTSVLLRELILASTQIMAPYSENSREGRITALLLDELRLSPVLPFYLPWPTDLRLQQHCQQLLDFPQQHSTIAQISQQLGISQMTLQRRFIQQTGLRFGQWRQQARLLLALEKLARGEKIISVALNVGYASQSAFTASFKQQFGLTPSLFCHQS